MVIIPDTYIVSMTILSVTTSVWHVCVLCQRRPTYYQTFSLPGSLLTPNIATKFWQRRLTGGDLRSVCIW